LSAAGARAVPEPLAFPWSVAHAAWVARILVIDDEPRIVTFVARVLTSEGWAVDTAIDGHTGLRMAQTGVYDLVILDLLLPGLDGTSLLAELMDERPEQPVLVLSAVAEVEDRVRCLRLGAADYMVKPFAIPELVARANARMRFCNQCTGPNHTYRVGSMSLHGQSRTVDLGNGSIHLSEKEYLLLQHLMHRSPNVVGREELLADVWGLSFDPGSNVVEVCVGRLRQKIGNQLIETVRHVGYRVIAP
jgi:DNA-binding response OmpR family regulator